MLKWTVQAVLLAAGGWTCAKSMSAPRGIITVDLNGTCGDSVELRLEGHAFRHFWNLISTDDKLCGLPDGGFAFLDELGRCSDENRMSCDLKTSPFESSGEDSMNREEPIEDSNSYYQKRMKQLPEMLGSCGDSSDDSEKQIETKVNLVLMIRFSNHKTANLPSKEDYDILMNSDSNHPLYAQTGSLKTYYEEQSYGKLSIQSVLSDWIDVDFTEREAAGEYDVNGPCNGICSNSRLREAIVQGLERFERKDPERFALVRSEDNITASMFSVIHSGLGAEAGRGSAESNFWIWSHRHQLNTRFFSPINNIEFQPYFVAPALFGDSRPNAPITRLGVIAHETAHYLGLPDLYDTDESSYGIGLYDIMANSWGRDQSQLYPGSFSAPAKILLGWICPRMIGTGIANTDVSYYLEPIATTGDALMMSLNHRLPTLSENELFSLELVVAEYREKQGWDQKLESGILLWHMDWSLLTNIGVFQNSVNRFELNALDPDSWLREHYGVRLIQADDFHDLENRYNEFDTGDWWINPSQVADDDSIHPNLQTYQLAQQRIRSGHALKNFELVNGEYKITYFYEMQQGPTSGSPNVRPPEEELSLAVYIAIGVGAAIISGFLASYAMDKLLPAPTSRRGTIVVHRESVVSSAPTRTFDQKSFNTKQLAVTNHQPSDLVLDNMESDLQDSFSDDEDDNKRDNDDAKYKEDDVALTSHGSKFSL